MYKINEEYLSFNIYENYSEKFTLKINIYIMFMLMMTT